MTGNYYMNWLQRLFSDDQASPAKSSRGAGPISSSAAAAKAYINKVNKKLDGVVSDFAKGKINSIQFQELYGHYQHEIQQIESLIATDPEAWEEGATEGKSIVIRRQHMASAQAYAIYENETGLPLGTLGKFRLDPALVIPMLSSYQSATKEIFGAGMRLTQMRDGHRLCFVPGKFTTLLAVFNNEPIPNQLDYLDKLHQHFEGANLPVLTDKPIDTDKLIFPHEYFLGKWQK
jgi:hypothetical protein